MVSRWAMALSVAVMAAGFAAALPARADIGQLEKDFRTPPDDARIMVRWWWFGPAVTKEGIERELKAMKAGGIGGVEVQCTYPLAVDGGTGDAQVKNLKFLSPEHLEMLGFAAAKCKELGMRMDLTLGSGWPYGGPMFTPSEGAGALETSVVQVAAGQTSIAVPQLRAGRKAFAAFAGPAPEGGGGGRGAGRGGRGGNNVNADVSKMREVPIQNGAAQLPADFAGGEVTFFVSGRTGMMVKRPANGAEGLVIDHLSAAVVDKFIREEAEPAIKACGENPPYAIFCDSLEVQGENWTDDFLAEFQKYRGYDLRPYLPALVGNIGDKTEEIRHDYGQTITDIFDHNFNAKLQALAEKYHTRFRIQGYGSPAAGLLSYAFSDLPEGEGGGNGNWRTFRTTRYASSASHLLGQKVTSSETFTWLHGAPFRATPLDIKGEVDTHFLDGINQIICHGWPYTGNGASYPGWSFYAAAVFDDKNPWYIAMPEITGYMQRVSEMMREGTPANDIALYLPDSDVWSKAAVGYSSMNTAFTQLSGLLGNILDAGYNVDAWDDGMLAMKGKVEGGQLVFGDAKYRAVVLDGAEHMPLATAEKLEQFAKGGGIIVAVGNTPTKVPGFQATAEDQQKLASIMKEIFSANSRTAMVVPAEIAVAATLPGKIQPDVTFTPGDPAIGAVHRHTEDAELYFIANTSNQKKRVNASFRDARGTPPSVWNPLTGKIDMYKSAWIAEGNGAMSGDLQLEPYGSTILVFTRRNLPDLPAKPPLAASDFPATVDLSGGWKVTLGEKTVDMDHLVSWTELPGMQNYSGVGTYQKTLHMTKEMLATGARWSLNLSDGSTPAGGAGPGRGQQGYAALLEAPVRDAAVVYVNGNRAGAAWTPPYRVELTDLLKEGDNALRIDVGNTAVNYLAGHKFPNYDNAGIRQVYGNRFDPQGTQLLSQPLPSGLLGPIRLEPMPP